MLSARSRAEWSSLGSRLRFALALLRCIERAISHLRPDFDITLRLSLEPHISLSLDYPQLGSAVGSVKANWAMETGMDWPNLTSLPFCEEGKRIICQAN
jgi:hypothetical protein